jgi:hypothetical protein
MAGPGSDVFEVVRFDYRAQLGVAELAAMVVHDSGLGRPTGGQGGLQLDGHRSPGEFRKQPCFM